MRTSMQNALGRGLPLLVWLWAGAATAQTVCADFWALPKFSYKQCTLAIQATGAAEIPCIRTVYKAFGEDMSCLKRFVHANQDRPHVVQVFIANETCHRAGRKCTKHDTPTYKVKMRNHRIAVTDAIAEEYGRRFDTLETKLEGFINEQTTVIYPVALEDNFTRKGWRKISGNVATRSPESNLVRNSQRNLLLADLDNAAFNELHTGIPTSGAIPCIFSNDGRDIDFGTRRRPAGDPLGYTAARERLWDSATGCHYTGIWFDAQGVSNAWRSGRGRFVYPRSRRIGDISADLRKLKKLIWEVDSVL